MSRTTELAANLLAIKSLTDAKKRVAFPTSKPPPGCPGRIIPSMNCSFSSRVWWVRWIKRVADKSFFARQKKVLNSLGLRQENTFLKGFYGNSFYNRAREKPFCTAVAEGNDHLSYRWRKFTLLPKPWLFSQKLHSSGRMLGASARRGFYFCVWLRLSWQIPSVMGLLWKRDSGR